MTVLLSMLTAGPAAAVQNQCAVCHATLGEKHQAILKAFDNDIHRERGLSCDSCHGGNPALDDAAAAMSPDAGFVGAPSKADMPKFCGKCHSNPAYMKKFNPSLPVDQELTYYTSVHGQRLKAGDAAVAACADCHIAHSIRPAKDPTSSVYVKNIPQTCGKCHSNVQLMAPYKIPTDQLAQYTSSVHGKALFEKGDTAAPVCTTCHGNHGAVPPGVENIGQVCGMCHVHNAEFFQSSPMAKPWAKRKFHMCATCHHEHDIQHPTAQLLSPDNGICMKCHSPSSPQIAVASAMQKKLESIEDAYQRAQKDILAAEEKGMDMAEARDLWDASRMAMYQSKTAIHHFSAASVAEVADPGIQNAEKADQAAKDAAADFQNRRIGLGVASLFITFLVVVIYLKIKDFESSQG